MLRDCTLLRPSLRQSITLFLCLQSLVPLLRPKSVITSNIALAYPHVTAVAVYPISGLVWPNANKCDWNPNSLLHLGEIKRQSDSSVGKLLDTDNKITYEAELCVCGQVGMEGQNPTPFPHHAQKNIWNAHFFRSSTRSHVQTDGPTDNKASYGL